MNFLKKSIFVLCSTVVGCASMVNAMTQSGPATVSLVSNELQNSVMGIIGKGAQQTLEHPATQTIAVTLAKDVPVLVAPAVSMAPVVAQSVWGAVRDNTKEIANNVIGAGANVASYVPYALRQITHEVKTLTNALQDMPIVTTALIVAAGYGCWKAYCWFKKPHVREYIENVRQQVIHRSQWRNDGNV